MKRITSWAVRELAVGLTVLWAGAVGVEGQTNLELSVQLYAGLTIAGAVGSVCSMQCATNPAQDGVWEFLFWCGQSATRVHGVCVTAKSSLVKGPVGLAKRFEQPLDVMGNAWRHGEIVRNS